MGDIIPIQPYYHTNPEYQLELLEIIGKLTDIEEALKDNLVNLATKGKWKEWSDGIPGGEVFTFTEEMLSNTGDQNINAVYHLIKQIATIKCSFKIIF